MRILEEAGPCVADHEEGSLYNKSVDIKRCWIKYGIALIELSWMRLLSEDILNETGK